MFDRETDPQELDNLLKNDANRSDAERLHGLLRSHLDSSTDTYVLDPALGYDGLHQYE